jgi:nitrogen fixation/metabolism regulation signal transduction histidine kinase
MIWINVPQGSRRDATLRVANRLFEPYVTTKPKGLGQGLSICRRIIECAWRQAMDRAGTAKGGRIPILAARR